MNILVSFNKPTIFFPLEGLANYVLTATYPIAERLGKLMAIRNLQRCISDLEEGVVETMTLCIITLLEEGMEAFPQNIKVNRAIYSDALDCYSPHQKISEPGLF